MLSQNRNDDHLGFGIQESAWVPESEEAGGVPRRGGPQMSYATDHQAVAQKGIFLDPPGTTALSGEFYSSIG